MCASGIDSSDGTLICNTGCLYLRRGDKESARTWWRRLLDSPDVDERRRAECSAKWTGRPPYNKIFDLDITICTDGSALGNPGPGGYGAVLLSGPFRRRCRPVSADTNNNVG